jgi:hypothetical protein
MLGMARVRTSGLYMNVSTRPFLFNAGGRGGRRKMLGPRILILRFGL